MKKLSSILILLALAFMANAQPISGVKTIPGDFATIASAINALNTSGTTAPGVTFNIASGHTEQGINLILNTNTSSASAPIVFRKAPGAAINPKITSGNGVWNSSTDGAIIIAGSDYVTFNGIDITANDNTVDWGYGLVKKSNTAPFDGCQNVTIKNCTITMVRTNANSHGIYAGNHTAANTTALTINAPTDACNNSKFFNNTINNVTNGIVLLGFNAPAPYSLFDQNNEIGVDGPNIISGYGGGFNSVGISGTYQNNINIANNSISTGANSTGQYSFYGILLGAGLQSSASVTNNTISINMSASSTPQAIYAINSQIGYYGATNTVNISNNTIANCTFPTSNTSPFYGIYNPTTYNGPGSVNMTNNTLHDISMGGSGSLYGIDGETGLTVNISNNTLYNLTNNGNGYLFALKSYNGTTNVYNNIVHDLTIGSGSNALYGLYEAGYASIENYYNNQFYNMFHNGNGAVYGRLMNTTTGTRLVYSNLIHSLASAGGIVCGMQHQSSTPSVYRNTIYDLTSTTATGQVTGIHFYSGTNAIAYNNYISDLKTPAATGTNAVCGIYVGGVNPLSLYYNTIYLNAASTSTTTFGSCGIFHTNSFSLELKNNIVVNTSTPVFTTGPSFTAALYRSGTSLSSYSVNSNNNCFYAGVPGANNVIYCDGTNADQSISLFKVRVTPRETVSITEMPQFVNAPGQNLHIQPLASTLLESAGARITTPLAITTDFDNNFRWGEAGYSGSGTSTDIGAEEGNFTNPGIMNYQGCTTDQVSGNTFSGTVNQPMIRMKVTVTGGASPITITQFICNATGTTAITDINATASKVYYTGNSPEYGPGILFGSITPTIANFNIAGSQVLVPGDNYFWLTFDVIQTALTGHIIDGQCSSITVAGSAKTPAITSPAGNLNILGPMSGEYLIGAGNITPNFPTLTDAVNHINHRGCGGPVTFRLTNTATVPYNGSNGEVFPIIVGVIPLASAINKVTLQPATGKSPVISGSTTTSVLHFKGTDFFTIDGSKDGSNSRDLLIENTSTSHWSAAIQLSSLGISAGSTFLTFKNCIIRGGSPGSISGYTCAFSAGSAIGTGGYDNDNLTITNNEISRAYYAFYASGSGAGVMDSLKMTNNTIGSDLPQNYIGNTAVYLSTAQVDMTGNEVKGLASTNVSPTGIYVGPGVKNTLINRNMLHSIKVNAGIGMGAVGMIVDLGSAGSNVTIANNLLYDISGDGSSNIYSYGTAGIKIAGGSTNVKIYHNSISLSGQISRAAATSDISAVIHVWLSVSQIDIRNNILANSIENITGVSKAYGIYSEAGASAFTALDYNNYYITGREAVFGYFGGSDKTTLAAWQAATTKDPNSIVNDPNFNASTVLVPYPGSNELDRCPIIATITDDFLGAARIAPVSMGAYEAGNDLTPPVVSYTPLYNTHLLTARTLTTTITDFYSTVPKSGAGLPRLYWRINGNPYTAVTGVWISGNTYQFTFGNFVQPGNTVSYFIVCQDEMTFPNTGATPAAGASGLTSTPPACISPPSNPSSYMIVNALSGVKNIPGDYPNLTGAAGLFADINSKSLSGNLTVNIVGNTTEDGLNALNEIHIEDPAYRLTIVNSGNYHKISGSYTGALIRFNGADNVTINGKGKLWFYNANLYTSITLQMSGGCSGNTIDSCSFSTGKNSYTYNTAINLTGLLTNNVFRYDSIYSANIGVNLNSEYWGNGSGNAFIGNCIGHTTGSASLYNNGIMAYYQDNLLISKNHIFNIQSGGSPLGIYAEGVTNSLIDRNNLHDIIYIGSSYYGSGGIMIKSLGGSPNVTIRNNLISHMAGIGNSPNTGDYNDIPGGIKLLGSATSGIMLYNNSVFLIPDPVYGVFFNNEWFCALEIGAGVSGVIMKNNILKNSVGEMTGRTITSWGYSVYNKKTTNPFASVNNNIYFTSNFDNNYVALNGTAVPPVNNLNFTGWQTFTGQDAQSLNADPLFTSNTNLTPQAGSPAIGSGVSLPGIVDEDYYGNARGVNTTIGAIEMVPAMTKTLTVTLFLQGLYQGGGVMKASRDNTGPHWGSTVADHISIELHDATPGNYGTILYTATNVSLSTSGQASAFIPAGLNGSYYITIRHRNGLPTVSATPVSLAGASATYAFDAFAKAYGNKLVALPGGGYAIYSGDLNQDGTINSTDKMLAGTASGSFINGYSAGDVNGDGTEDSADMTFIDNNAAVGIIAATP